MTKIKTVEEAFKARGLNFESLPDVSTFPEAIQKYILNHFILTVVVAAINEGWEPNWNDHSQRKYFPYFEVEANEENPAGVGFSHTFYVFWYTDTTVGSRLCFKSSELAVYAAEQFPELWKENQLIIK
jgi:hypothetical protein